jgi:hypothetical protein
MINDCPYKKAFANYEKDIEQLQSIEIKLIDGLKADSAALEKIRGEIKRRKVTKKDRDAVNDLEAKCKVFLAQKSKLVDSAKAATDRYYGAIDAANETFLVRVRGLVGYVLGTHQGDAGYAYLRDELKAYDDMKGNFGARRTKFSEICDVISAVVAAEEKQRGTTWPADSKIAAYERIQTNDPEHGTAFYRENRDAILEEYEFRRLNQQP